MTDGDIGNFGKFPCSFVSFSFGKSTVMTKLDVMKNIYSKGSNTWVKPAQGFEDKQAFSFIPLLLSNSFHVCHGFGYGNACLCIEIH